MVKVVRKPRYSTMTIGKKLQKALVLFSQSLVLSTPSWRDLTISFSTGICYQCQFPVTRESFIAKPYQRPKVGIQTHDTAYPGHKEERSHAQYVKRYVDDVVRSFQ